jgi:hypothetical protein
MRVVPTTSTASVDDSVVTVDTTVDSDVDGVRSLMRPTSPNQAGRDARTGVKGPVSRGDARRRGCGAHREPTNAVSGTTRERGIADESQSVNERMCGESDRGD